MHKPLEEIDVINTPEEFYGLREQWHDLWVRAQGMHHESFIVCWLVWNCVAKPAGRSLRIVTVRRDRRLIALWPLVRYRHRLWTVLQPLGPDSTDYTTVLADRDHASGQLTKSIWLAVQKQCGADLIVLPYLDCGSHLYRLAVEHEGLVRDKVDSNAVARLSREANWESFAASLGTMSGWKPGALRRRIEKKGKVEARMLGPEDKDENARMIDWMLASKRQWAERVNKKGTWLYSHAYRDFLVALANQPGEGDEDACARILVLRMDDAPIAVSLVGMGKGSIVGVMNSFDPRHAKLMPGAISVEAWVKWALERKQDFDLGVGDERFKPYWSKGNVAAVSSIEIAHSAWGRVVHAMREVRASRRPSVPLRQENI
ncbi:GNAT family N-acetyltransferase [Caballeronia grimmiae]|uniref:GNAT family N-acetyltransferase n=1 Tax=Caballeronia grimmiae TaxID=1071679 RepID=UPI0038BB5EFA